MASSHHHRSPGAFSGHVPEDQEAATVNENQMVNEVAAYFTRWLNDDVDLKGTARFARWRQGHLKAAGFLKFRLFARQLFGASVSQVLLLKGRQHARAQQGGVERLKDEILGAQLDGAHDGGQFVHGGNDNHRQALDAPFSVHCF
jgi:hypothetical protein